MKELRQNAVELYDHFLRADPITFQLFMEAAEKLIKSDSFVFSEKLLNDLRLFGIIIDKAKENFKASKYQRKNYARLALARGIKKILKDNQIDCTIYKYGLWTICMQIVLSYCKETLSAETILSILSKAEKQDPGYHGNILIPE
jgi:hypothetical protein